MPHIKSIALTLILFVGCSQIVSKPTVAVESSPILIGPITRDQLTAEPYGNWFGPGYEQFEVDSALSSQLRDRIKDIDILIFFGTWCGDSKREVPKIYRIFDALNVPERRIRLVAMDRNKETPDNLENGLEIRRVPTILFYESGIELGRIIERPVKTLMEDMQAILLPEGTPAD
ncbi:thioredoxin family protein [Candidatus Neomarinimicrobiota bacterium]